MTNPPLHQNRRGFISGIGAICAGTAADASAAARLAGSAAKLAGNAGQFDADQFRACLGKRFTVQALGRDLPAVNTTLTRVAPVAFGPAASPGQSFAIDLVATDGVLRQDTYAVTNTVMGEFVALLVPSADGRTLTGVFHRYA